VSARAPRLRLRKNQDRRLRAGHPWIFSNEIARLEGDPADGALVEVLDARGAFLGRAYYNHRSLIAARLLTRRREEVDVDFFVRRLERARDYRRAVAPMAEAVRLVHGEADQLPGLVVDRYRDWLAVQVLTLGMEVRADLLRPALERALEPRGAVRVADAPLRRLEGLPLERGAWWGEVPERVEVAQEGFALEADLLGGQKTGLFLDQRENRRLAEARARGRRALDLFCYQGEWALHLARGGAADVLGVDSSASALEAARRNAERNGLGDRTRWMEADAFEAARDLERQGERFGLIVVDPPALVRSRSHLAAGARAYREINRAAMSLLAADGVLVTCSCSHQLDDARFEQVLREAARSSGRAFRVASWTGAAADHPRLLAVPETHYLKCAVLEAVG
jgi:23S rRNA (cytosine1962-C5)-methyltransferase